MYTTQIASLVLYTRRDYDILAPISIVTLVMHRPYWRYLLDVWLLLLTDTADMFCIAYFDVYYSSHDFSVCSPCCPIPLSNLAHASNHHTDDENV